MSRASLCVLVPEAQTIAAVACIRSLGRAGHRVIACARDEAALGIASRYAAATLLAPGYEDRQAFGRWLAEQVRAYGVQLVIPSEGLLLAIRDELHSYLPMMAVEGSVERVLASMSKYDLFETFARAEDPRLRENLPGHLLLARGDEARAAAALATLRAPLYLKADGLHAAAGLGSEVRRFTDAGTLLQALPEYSRRYDRYMVQEHVDGVGVGVFLLRWNGEILAALMHRRLHEVPYTGGQSSLRETWWHDAVHADAVRRLEALDWRGVGMLEYRWDPATDRFRLMEFNARFWGSLHLALFAGVDFPALLVEAWRGAPRRCAPPPLGLKCRLTFPKEIEYVASRLKSGQLGTAEKLGTVIEFFALGLDPRVKSDLWFPGDTGLYWRSIRLAVRKFLS